MKTTIVTIPNMISESDWQPLVALGEVEYIERDSITEEELLELIRDSKYLMLNYDVVKKLSEHFYQQITARKLPLKAISTDITGMTWAQSALAKNHGVRLLNTPRHSTLSVAEFSLTSLLLMIKKMHLSIHDQINNFDTKDYKNTVFEDQTVGIIGLGDIGTCFAKLAQGVGMKTIAWNRTKKNIAGVQQLDSLPELFEQADHISIHLKTTPETKKLITRDMFFSLRSGCVVNQADSKLINLDDVADAIEAGSISGYSGSLKSMVGHRISDLPQSIGFPPQAWFTDHSLSELRRIWVQNILDAEQGNYPNLVEE